MDLFLPLHSGMVVSIQGFKDVKIKGVTIF